MYLPYEEEEAKKMIHLTIARSVIGAAVRTGIKYGPRAASAYRTTKNVRSKFSRRDSMREQRGSFVYIPTYAPEERWWE